MHVGDQSLKDRSEFSHNFVLVIPGDVLDAVESASECGLLIDHFQSVQDYSPIFSKIL